MAQFLKKKEAYTVDAKKLSDFQALASEEIEDLRAKENELEAGLGDLRKQVEHYEIEHGQITETFRVRKHR